MEKDAASSSLAQRIRRLREARGWSRPELARRAGLDQSTVWRLEASSRNNPGAETLRALARALDTTIEDLLGRERRGQVHTHFDLIPRPRGRQSGPPATSTWEVPLILDPSQPRRGDNVVGSIPLPNVLNLDPEDLFAFQLDEQIADGTWGEGALVFCAPSAPLSDADIVLVLVGTTARIRELRIVGSAMLAASRDTDELTPVTYRDILARVMAVLQRL